MSTLMNSQKKKKKDYTITKRMWYGRFVKHGDIKRRKTVVEISKEFWKTEASFLPAVNHKGKLETPVGRMRWHSLYGKKV